MTRAAKMCLWAAAVLAALLVVGLALIGYLLNSAMPHAPGSP